MLVLDLLAGFLQFVFPLNPPLLILLDHEL